MKKSIVAILLVSALAASGAGIWFYTLPKQESDSRGGRGDRALRVKVAPVTATEMPFVLEAVGTVEAEQSVAVRSEIGGVLRKIHFREGDLVKAGQLLFSIDADAQQAAVEKARADLARDTAALTEARAQARRLESLVAQEYVTQQEYAQAVVQEQAAQAAVRADRAMLQTMQLQLDHAHIRAPITGRAGMLNVKQGNLVSAASDTPLVVINATQPVLVVFSAPQQQLQSIRDGQRKKPLAVELRRDASDTLLATGALAFIDNAVDAQTGTIRMKARIPNQDETLWPGELVALRLVLGVQQDALVIPEAAVQPGQGGALVFVVSEGKAQQQAITVARQLGGQIVVAAGLKAGQQVILNPPRNLRPDTPVTVADEKAGEGKPRGGKEAAGKQP